jgi:tetratricopeptide (TPR) repeat protein
MIKIGMSLTRPLFPGVMLMNGNARRQIQRLVGSAVLILILCASSLFALQEKVSPLSDYQYKKDFPRYEAIKKEPDLQKRAELLLAFVKERGISRLLLNAVTDYQACVKPLLDKKEFAKAISMEEALQALLPTEKAVEAEQIPVGVEDYLKGQLQPSRLMIQNTLLAAYYQSQNWPKAAETAEKLYKMSPNKSLLLALADIYFKMKNMDQYLAYGKKILAEFPMDQPQGYSTAIQMAQVYLQKQDVADATDLLSKVMDVYGDKVPPNTQEAQWNATRAFAYGIIATKVYNEKDYTKAQELYEKVARFNPKREDAYYYIGMCQWQNKDPEGAIQSFAKCVVLKGQLAQKAQQYLEELYKARHNDSLDGLDQVLATARSQLGVTE